MLRSRLTDLSGPGALRAPGGPSGPAVPGIAAVGVVSVIAVVALLAALVAASFLLNSDDSSSSSAAPPTPQFSPGEPIARRPTPHEPSRALSGRHPSRGRAALAPGATNGSGLAGIPAKAGTDPEVVRHTELTHDHHRRFVWHLSLPLLALVAVILVIAYRATRLPREGQRSFAGLVAAVTLWLAMVSSAAGVDQRPGSGSYDREAAEVERSTNEAGTPVLTSKVHLHHLHPAVDLDVQLLAAGAGLLLLAFPNLRIAATRSRRDARPNGASA